MKRILFASLVVFTVVVVAETGTTPTTNTTPVVHNEGTSVNQPVQGQPTVQQDKGKLTAKTKPTCPR